VDVNISSHLGIKNANSQVPCKWGNPVYPIQKAHNPKNARRKEGVYDSLLLYTETIPVVYGDNPVFLDNKKRISSDCTAAKILW
jgi:hypothetical protein